MQASTLCFILATLGTLASATEHDEKKLKLYREMAGCCSTAKVLVSTFKYGALKCVGVHLADKIGSILTGKFSDFGEAQTAIKNGCLVECLFEENGYISEDRSVNEAKLRAAFLKKAGTTNEDVKPAVEATLDACFELLKNAEKNDVCKSGSHLLITCVLREILLNCPESAWKEKKKKCKGKLAQLKKEVMAVEKNQ